MVLTLQMEQPITAAEAVDYVLHALTKKDASNIHVDSVLINNDVVGNTYWGSLPPTLEAAYSVLFMRMHWRPGPAYTFLDNVEVKAVSVTDAMQKVEWRPDCLRAISAERI